MNDQVRQDALNAEWGTLDAEREAFIAEKEAEWLALYTRWGAVNDKQEPEREAIATEWHDLFAKWKTKQEVLDARGKSLAAEQMAIWKAREKQEELDYHPWLVDGDYEEDCEEE